MFLETRTKPTSFSEKWILEIFFSNFPASQFFFQKSKFSSPIGFSRQNSKFQISFWIFFLFFQNFGQKSNFWKDFYRNKKLKLFFFVANCDRNFKNTFLRKKILSQKKHLHLFRRRAASHRKLHNSKKNFWVKTINSNPVWEEHLSRLMRPSS